MFLSGVANNGAPPSVASASQRMQQEAGSKWWPIGLTGVGVGAPTIAITYPDADGQGAQAALPQDVYQESMWTRVPPMTQVNNGDTIDVFVEDQSGSAFDAFVSNLMDEGGTIPTRFNGDFGSVLG